MKVNEMLVTK